MKILKAEAFEEFPSIELRGVRVLSGVSVCIWFEKTPYLHFQVELASPDGDPRNSVFIPLTWGERVLDHLDDLGITLGTLLRVLGIIEKGQIDAEDALASIFTSLAEGIVIVRPSAGNLCFEMVFPGASPEGDAEIRFSGEVPFERVKHFLI